jgi:hypothetical protein
MYECLSLLQLSGISAGRQIYANAAVSLAHVTAGIEKMKEGATAPFVHGQTAIGLKVVKS